MVDRSASAARAASVLSRLSAFGSARGLGDDPATLLDPDVVEAFCARGLAGRSTSTKGTYRSVLLGLGEVQGWSRRGRGTPFPGSHASAPYSPAERAELLAIAAAQRSAAKASSALVVLLAGIGAGLRRGELVALRGSDVVCHDDHVVVAVRAGVSRAVPVQAACAQRLAGLARQAGEGVLFRPGLNARGYKNAVNDFARRLLADPCSPRLSLGRCRATFLCDHLQAGTPLGELLAIAGISEVGSLQRYTRYVPGAPASKAALRARLRDETR